MNLIDNTYFIGEINLPSSVLSGNLATIDAYIERYEKEFLKNLLGYDLYKELKAEIEDQTFTEKWDELVNGAEYTIGGYTKKWDGLINSEKVSPIAYYVYYNYLKANIVNYESIGAVSALSENSARVAADGLMINAWNRYVDLYNNAIEFLLVNSESYPKWILTAEEKNNTFGI